MHEVKLKTQWILMCESMSRLGQVVQVGLR